MRYVELGLAGCLEHRQLLAKLFLAMSIPNDPLNRFWVDASAINPNLVNDLRPALVAFLAFDHGRVPRIAGSGFIIAGKPDHALILTAKHVLSQGVLNIQQPRPLYATSALFVPASLLTPTLNPEKLKVIWMGSKSSGLLNTAHACYNDTLDIACCVIAPQESHTASFVPLSIPVDTRVPSIGDLIQMVSLDGMDVSEVAAPMDHTGAGQTISIERAVNIRVGTVTGIYPQGFRQYRWPCFTTSIPAKPGMSGGFVTLPSHGTTMGACGIVCADNSTEEAHTNCFVGGESVIACAWPTLALRLPLSIPSSNNTPTRTLYEMMRMGDLDLAIGGIDHIEVVDLDNNDCRIGMRLT